MSSSLPATLGKYQIIREIARSNDIVYEAYDPLLNRRVAIKELAMPSASTQAQQEDRIQRFEREARAAGTLQHPNIMTVYDRGNESGRYYIVMEFLDGHTLRNEIDVKGFIEPDRAVEIAIETLKGLEFAHSKGVIHRDIKPDNIQLLSDGRIKLTDFGIARLTFEPNLTIDGQVFGTPSYMSPEQVVGREIDARSDLFSLGVVLYEMLSGKKPFQGDSVVSITYAVMNEEPVQPQQCNYSLWQAMLKMLDKSPALRFGSATENISALESALEGMKSGSMVLDPAPPVHGHGHGTMYAPPASYPSTAYSATAPPPILYNPYGQQGQMPTMPPMPGMQMGHVPVYYPPPPRQPLLKPETKQTLGRVAAALALFTTIVVLVVALVSSLSNVFHAMRAQEQDRQTQALAPANDASKPVETRIAENENFKTKLTSPAAVESVDSKLAAMYEEKGKKQLGAKDASGAEQSFIRATELDPHNGAYFSDLGQLYASVASGQRDPGQSMSLWKLSSTKWQEAAELDRSPQTHDRYAEGAAISSYELAVDYDRVGQRQLARQMLYTARSYAPTNSSVKKLIADLMVELDGSG